MDAWASGPHFLHAWWKWLVYPRAGHRNEKEPWCGAPLSSLSVNRVGGRRVNGIHACQQLKHRLEARKR